MTLRANGLANIIGDGDGLVELSVAGGGNEIFDGFLGDISCVASNGLSKGTGLIETLALFSGDARNVTCLGMGDSVVSSPVSQSFGGGNAAVIGETNLASVAFFNSSSVILLPSTGESKSPVLLSRGLTFVELRCLRTTVGRTGAPFRPSSLGVVLGTAKLGLGSVGILGGKSGRARSCERNEEDDGTRCWCRPSRIAVPVTCCERTPSCRRPETAPLAIGTLRIAFQLVPIPLLVDSGPADGFSDNEGRGGNCGCGCGRGGSAG